MRKLCFIVAGCLAATTALFAQRQTQTLAHGWKFIREDAPLTAATEAWASVSVPHTWNAIDGQDGRTAGQPTRPDERGSDYYRGACWYVRTLEIPADWKTKRVFVRFEAASQVATVYLNGEAVGEHRGSFTAFCFELTSKLKFGAPNELRVRVDNTLVKTIAPLAGDFNVDGGLYRAVQLLVTDATCITPLDQASPGVYLTTRALTADAAEIEVKAQLSSAVASATDTVVTAEIFDEAGRSVATARASQTLAAGAALQSATLSLRIPQPHLWAGLADPYCYRAVVRVLRGGQVVDEVTQPLGLRTVALSADGFLLNGKLYPIYGVNRHQDLKDHGWALSPADDERDVQLIRDLGATAVRLAHYPQSTHVHTLADHSGILLWDEAPLVNNVPDAQESPEAPSEQTRAFAANLEDQTREMVLQLYNHPSIAWWGIFNEIRPNPTSAVALPIVRRLNALVKELDPSRPTVAASDRLTNPTNFVTDTLAYNVYPGWYTGNGDTGELAKLIDDRFAEQKSQRVALSEYGAGGNPAQHQEGALTKPKANNGPVHPEEWQALMHERDWAQIRGNPKLWGTFIWVLADFSSDGRSEGGIASLNDKGLVTHDRAITKDAYHFYRANWSTRPMVYLASRRSTPRKTATTEVKVYSNCPEVELSLNGKSLGTARPDEIHIARWPDVTLQPGKNTLVVRANRDGTAVNDTCELTLETTP